MIDLHAINKHGNHTANQGWQHSVLEPDDFVSYLTVVGMELQDYKNLQDMGIYVTYLPKLTPN